MHPRKHEAREEREKSKRLQDIPFFANVVSFVSSWSSLRILDHTETCMTSVRYRLLISAQSFGVRPASGTRSSSTTAQPS